MCDDRTARIPQAEKEILFESGPQASLREPVFHGRKEVHVPPEQFEVEWISLYGEIKRVEDLRLPRDLREHILGDVMRKYVIPGLDIRKQEFLPVIHFRGFYEFEIMHEDRGLPNGSPLTKHDDVKKKIC